MTALRRLAEPYFVLELDGQEVQRFDLARPRTSIGRAREAEIQIAVRGVSRTHAIVLRDDTGRCVLEDQGSANGTFVNGARIDGRHELALGDAINFLDYTLRFHREGTEAPAPQPDEGLMTTESSELPFEPDDAFLGDDAIPTEEGPALGLRAHTITTARSAARRAAQRDGAVLWEVSVDDPELGRTTHVLEGDVTSVGGEESSHIRISGRRLERHHSMFVRLEDKLVFVRLSALHIARVNGTARMVTFLEPGDEIVIGGVTMTVSRR